MEECEAEGMREKGLIVRKAPPLILISKRLFIPQGDFKTPMDLLDLVISQRIIIDVHSPF